MDIRESGSSRNMWIPGRPRAFLFLLLTFLSVPSMVRADEFVLTAAFARQKGLRTGTPVHFLGTRVGRVISVRLSDERADLARPYLLELAVSGATLEQLREHKGAVAIVSVSGTGSGATAGVSLELVPSADGKLPPQPLEGFGSFEEFWLADSAAPKGANKKPAAKP